MHRKKKLENDSELRNHMFIAQYNSTIVNLFIHRTVKKISRDISVLVTELEIFDTTQTTGDFCTTFFLQL